MNSIEKLTLVLVFSDNKDNMLSETRNSEWTNKRETSHQGWIADTPKVLMRPKDRMDELQMK